MIRHICMFKLVEDDKERARSEFLEASEMLLAIPEIINFSVVENSKDAPQDNFDVSLIIDLGSAGDLAAYSACDIHREFKKAISGLKTARACIDHEI